MSDDEAAELAEHEARLAALEAANRELRAKLDEQNRFINGMTEFVKKLVEDNAAETQFWWPGMTKAEASALWDRLLPWVDMIADRYPSIFTSYSFRSCWYRHLDQLDLMTSIYVNWTSAYARNGPHPIDFQRRLADDLGLLKPRLSTCNVSSCRLDPEEGPKSRDQVKRELLATLPASRVSGGDWEPPDDLD